MYLHMDGDNGDYFSNEGETFYYMHSGIIQ